MVPIRTVLPTVCSVQACVLQQQQVMCRRANSSSTSASNHHFQVIVVGGGHAGTEAAAAAARYIQQVSQSYIKMPEITADRTGDFLKSKLLEAAKPAKPCLYVQRSPKN